MLHLVKKPLKFNFGYNDTVFWMNTYESGWWYYARKTDYYDLITKKYPKPSFYQKHKKKIKKLTKKILLILLIIGILIYIRLYLTYKKRKIRANELEDEFDYTSQSNVNDNSKNKLLGI